MLREEDIFKLKEILVNTLELDESDNIDEITKLNCIKWDSLAQAIIIAAVADEFSIDISEMNSRCLNSFKSIKLFLEGKKPENLNEI